MKNLIIVCLLIGVSIFSCKKEKDTITQHDIKGMVFNNCTDSGLANITVFLQDGQGLNLSTVSGANGSFNFNNVQIHSNTKYDYVIYIPSKSGTNATTFEYCGFDGTTMYFNHDEADIFFMPRVTPRYLYFCMDFPNSTIIPNGDSIRLYYYQKKIHKNVPDLPFDGIIGKYGIYDIGCGANYPMGQWNMVIDKWKSNVHTTVYDSIYLGWGSNITYTVNW